MVENDEVESDGGWIVCGEYTVGSAATESIVERSLYDYYLINLN